MLRTTLHRNDGMTSGRLWLRSVVRTAQCALRESGAGIEPDGRFGGQTRTAVQEFQASAGLLDNGVVDKGTWAALDVHLQVALADEQRSVQQNLAGFVGDLHWVHEKEGHRGRPYWPGGASGVTLDPGVDLGHQDAQSLERLYEPLLSASQLSALQTVLGLTGESARAALQASPQIQAIRIDEEAAAALLPVAAAPYWTAISTRFPSLVSGAALPSVQTVLLSLAYNRGAANHHLEILRPGLAAAHWLQVAEKVRGMQQSHELAGIRQRRRDEGDLIRAELEHLQA